MRFEFHPEALAEYREAAQFYAGAQAGLEERFILCVEEAVRKIVEAPNRWRIYHGDVRRCLTRVFPYGILYSLEPGYVLIVAVMHCSRKPSYWKDRLQS